MHPFFKDFDRPIGLRAALYQNTPILTFDFHPPVTRVYPWGPRGASDQKVA